MSASSDQGNGRADDTKNKDKESDNGEELHSYAAETGEWSTRQISIMGVVKRFISQLSYGQDLTKISMPSEFLLPFSVLEFVSLRYLTRFPILIEANNHSEPQYRMLHVIRWFLASLVDAKMYKKPYNPVVCETHSCFIENNGGITQFIGEQVTHHPPVSAMHVRNDESGVSLQGNISFGVKFWLNSVTINTSGYLSVNMAKHGDEEYVFQKALPDLHLKNVVFGTRRMRWQSSLEIFCAKTNCEAEITFNQSGNDETLTGSISRDGETLLTFEGSLDSEVTFKDADSDEEQVLFTCEQVPIPKILIPPQTDPYPSLKVWKEVSKHIIGNTMTEADKAKNVVEDEQRVRTRAGEDEKKERKYFIYSEEKERWVYKDGSFQINQ